MNLLKSILVFVLSLFFMLTACKKDNDEKTGNSIDIYLISEFETINNTQEIDKNSVELSDNPLVFYNDIISYDAHNYLFKITEEAKTRINNLDDSIYTAAFAVTVDDEIIYTGYFWPGFLSSTCNWVVIDPLLLDVANALKVQLGYPETIEGVTIPDYRNDSRIIDIFRKDNKLIE